MKWYVALMYNFLSAVVAIIGMFVGVGICHASEDAIPWILSFAAGLFLYVALVDLVCYCVAIDHSKHMHILCT